MRYIQSTALAAVFLMNPLVAQEASTKPKSEKVLAQAADVSPGKSDSTEDTEALRRWLRDKRMVSIKELGGDLSLSAEVRTEFQAIGEKARQQGSSEFIRQRGDGAPTGRKPMPKPMYAWDVELNLMLDYRTDRAWAATRVEFDNDMGQRSGSGDHIKLEKAYIGGRIVAGDTLIIDTEIGRRYLFDVYDSKIEFASVFDGALFRFSKAFPSIGDYYFLPGAFLINDSSNHYGLVAEMGGLNIANTGLHIKYSIIDWYRPGGENLTGQTAAQTKAEQLRYKFLVSQLQFQYLMYPQWIGGRLVKFYTAGLVNHLAHGLEITRNEKQNWGWFTGVTFGVVKKKGDWSVDINYQGVQAQAIPEFDCSGIGRGNALGLGFYTQYADGSGAPNTSATQPVGGTNYQGFEMAGLYAFTNNITVQQFFKMSWTLDTNIGPNIQYKQYEIEFVYAF
jgi:hypothetical protein